MRTKSTILFALVALLLGLGASAVADSPQTGTLEGRVLDASGEPLPGVTVTLSGDRGEQTAVTNAEGLYRFALLPPGVYTVAAALEGLEGSGVSVRVETGQRRSQDLRMSAAEETITVVAEAPLINKYDVGTSGSVEEEVVEELSFGTRNYQSVVTMLPGAVHNSTSQPLADTRVGFNGSLWRENAVFVDGVDVTNTRAGGSTRLVLPSTAMTEIRADGSGMSAEYGRVTGGVTGVVTKSGTNNFHGEFLYIAQNPKWRAESEHLPIPRPDETFDSFETAFGGPLKRDRVWFFLSLGETNTNETGILRTGALVDESLESEPFIGKINAQPTDRHAFSVTFIDVPIEKSVPNPSTGDLFAVPNFDLSGDFTTATWNWAASDDLFLEVRAADQSSISDRTSLMQRDLDPNGMIHTSFGSVGQWFDLSQGLQFNFVSFGTGEGLEDFPRDQANAAVTWFRGANEIKLGADFQDVEWGTENRLPAQFRGLAYDPSLPGGFAQPQVMRVFAPADGPAVSASENLAFYAQDRLSWGDHWAATFGLRLEDQSHDNDVGQEVLESTDLAPRLAAVYDVHANGRLLVKGTLGRYYYHVASEIINNEFGQTSSGANEFDEFAWNPATQRYDIFLRSFIPAQNVTLTEGIDPYFKDEVTAGIEWQFSPSWAFEARAIYWEQDDLFWATDQIAPDGTIFRQLTNFDEGERDYQGLQLELNRRFRNNWVLRTNYTLSEAEGNTYGNFGVANAAGGLADDDFLDARTVINPATGQPFTADNRFGRGPSDRTHVFNLSAARNWNVGRHTLSLGGFFWFRTGEPWGRVPPIIFAPFPVPPPIPIIPVVVVPGLRGVLQSSRFAEPRDTNELEDTMSLNLTGAWTFPLGSRVQGSVRAEMTNVTDEQEQTLVNLFTGGQLPLRAGFQFPREFRLLAGLRF